MNKEKKYTLEQIAICNYTQDHIFPKAQAKKMGKELFCSAACKEGRKRDIEWERGL